MIKRVTYSSSKNNLKINNQKISQSPFHCYAKITILEVCLSFRTKKTFWCGSETTDLHLSWTPAWISKGRSFFYSSLLCLVILSSQPCQTGWMSSWDMKLSWWNPGWGLLISEVNFKHEVSFLQSSVWRLICCTVFREERLIPGLSTETCIRGLVQARKRSSSLTV